MRVTLRSFTVEPPAENSERKTRASPSNWPVSTIHVSDSFQTLALFTTIRAASLSMARSI
jgi:hypothetical protein